MKNNLLIVIIGLVFSVSHIHGQGVAVNNSGLSADSSAMLDVASTNAGVLIPRMTSAQKNTILSPATGLMIFQTDSTPGIRYFAGGLWRSISDQWGAQTVATDSSLSGNGTSASPLRLSQHGASSGQVLKWNGSNWVPGNVSSSLVPPTGTMVLIYNDETTSTYSISSPGGTTILKTYTLPANTYSNIKVEAEGSFNVGANGGGTNSASANILVGGSSLKSCDFVRPVHDYSSWTIPFCVSGITVQQASAIIQVEVNLSLGGSCSGIISIKAFRVYGIY
jgi:hypothetical protein